ncbi:MAG: phospholipid carrier-dependent glycosyltransferase [Gammaproteobacteria bacterium]|nr:phospholipid carrier-dependent glycosyltransferase [Gammaproteobacteria bacterium]MBU1624193.1 phospholipid carrier-dependent glycosyltransferase [Gammaproteobacteria bacterium]MBU1981921.1 phospholipid carrier-dependent glycosyltransferase [Gammaproteobacteria bacterium]
MRYFAESRPLQYLAAVVLAVFVYFYALDGLHIPRNGDENVYAHITRLTALSGDWLPLQSNLDNMRNTKPPLLFWQGIASTEGGAQWDRWHLRYPSVIYTLLTAWLVFLLGRKLGGAWAVGATASLLFLAFFSTYRFGRPYLTNPAETFWLFLPFFTLLYWRERAFDSRFVVPLLLGAITGIGLLYKSFALLAPVGLALTWWYLFQRRYRLRPFLLHDVSRLAIVAIVALAVFALWFVLDPDPQAVWQEFVVGENAGKFDPHGDSYWMKLLWGGSSVWVLLLGYPLNAGLLAFPVMALFVVAWQRRYRMNDEERMLWMWMIVLFVIFAIPSQRSARYLIDAMPGVALLLALNWQRIPRVVFIASLLASAAVLALFGWLAYNLEAQMSGLYDAAFWAVLAITLLLSVLAVLQARWTRGLTNVVALLTLLVLAMLLRPFDGEAGRFDVAAQQATQDKDVWVPCDFRASWEDYRFLLPAARIHGYHAQPPVPMDELKANYALFAVQLPLQDKPCAECEVLGSRLEIRGRHNDEEIKAMLGGDVMQQLFVREWLLRAPAGDGEKMQNVEGCR